MKKNTPYIITLSRLAILLLCSSLLVGCTGALPNAYSKAREKRKKSWLIMVLRERSKLRISKR